MDKAKKWQQPSLKSFEKQIISNVGADKLSAEPYNLPDMKSLLDLVLVEYIKIGMGGKLKRQVHTIFIVKLIAGYSAALIAAYIGLFSATATSNPTNITRWVPYLKWKKSDFSTAAEGFDSREVQTRLLYGVISYFILYAIYLFCVYFMEKNIIFVGESQPAGPDGEGNTFTVSTRAKAGDRNESASAVHYTIFYRNDSGKKSDIKFPIQGWFDSDANLDLNSMLQDLEKSHFLDKLVSRA